MEQLQLDRLVEQLEGAFGEEPPFSSAELSSGQVDVLRQVFGDASGLTIETAPGAGTKVSFVVPKFSPGISDDDYASR